MQIVRLLSRIVQGYRQGSMRRLLSSSRRAHSAMRRRRRPKSSVVVRRRHARSTKRSWSSSRQRRPNSSMNVHYYSSGSRYGMTPLLWRRKRRRRQYERLPARLPHPYLPRQRCQSPPPSLHSTRRLRSRRLPFRGHSRRHSRHHPQWSRPRLREWRLPLPHVSPQPLHPIRHPLSTFLRALLCRYHPHPSPIPPQQPPPPPTPPLRPTTLPPLLQPLRRSSMASHSRT